MGKTYQDNGPELKASQKSNIDPFVSTTHSLFSIHAPSAVKIPLKDRIKTSMKKHLRTAMMKSRELKNCMAIDLPYIQKRSNYRHFDGYVCIKYLCFD